MRKTLLVLLATAGLSAAVPALAQSQFAPPSQQVQVSFLIEEAYREGSLTRAEYQSFRNDMENIRRLQERYRPGGFSQAERRDIDQRLSQIQARVEAERWAQDRRGNDLRARIDTVDRTIRNALGSRDLDRRTAQPLTDELARINAQFADFRRSGDGFTRVEHDQLDRRIDQLTVRVRNAIRDFRPNGGGRGPDWNDNNPGRGPGWDNPGRGPDNNPGRGPGRGNDWNNGGRGRG